MVEITRRDFLKMAEIFSGSSLLAACAPRAAKVLATFEPTNTPFQPSTETPLPTPTETLVPRTLDNLFKLGTFDTATTKFTLESTPELMVAMDKRSFAIRYTHGDIPLPIKTPDFGTEDQKNIFRKSGIDNSSGNAYYVVGTNRRNHVFFEMHSLWMSTPGDLARELGGWAYNNPDELDNLLGKQLILTPDGSTPISAEVVFIQTIPREEYYDGKDGLFPWQFLPGNENPRLAVLETLGLPETITEDKTPNVYYITIIGCQNKVPGIRDKESKTMSRDEAYILNTTNSSLLTLKFKLP